METIQKTIGIRVDVDTSVGLKRGVPRLAELFHNRGAPASFYVVMGPDTMGKHIKRFGKKGYLKRILKVNPVRLIKSYGGIRPFLYGTILPSPMIGKANPEILHALRDGGFEVSIHGFNHAEWADGVYEMTQAQIMGDIAQALESYREIFGVDPPGFAAPNWRCPIAAWRALLELPFQYLSNTRGSCPFYPLVAGDPSRLLDIPVTLPTLHELLQTGTPKDQAVDRLMGLLGPGVNIWNVHDWLEGLNEIEFADNMIARALDAGFKFLTLEQIARIYSERKLPAPACAVLKAPVPGGIGEVSIQAPEDSNGKTR